MALILLFYFAFLIFSIIFVILVLKFFMIGLEWIAQISKEITR